jgi:hypothetical protein
LRGRADDDIHPADKEGRDERAQHEADIIGDAEARSLRCG